jgi:hypothetical protein
MKILQNIIGFARRWLTRLVRRRVPPARIAKAFMVVDGRIVEITEKHINEGFRNCKSITTLSSFQFPDSITSAAFDLESNATADQMEPQATLGQADGCCGALRSLEAYQKINEKG